MHHDVICGVSEEQAARHELPAEERLAESFDRMRALARTLPSDAIRRYSLDAHLAFWNAREAFKIIAPYLDELRGLPRVDVAAIERIPDLAMALLHSVRLIHLIDPPKTNVAERLFRARRLRYAMLHQAMAAAGIGLIPETPVERIQQGTGPIDTVEDLLALATLFDQHRSVLVGPIVTEELLREAERLGRSLEDDLRPSPARRSQQEKEQELAQAIDDRNRIATLLVHAHAEVQTAAAYLRLKVPALQARRGARKKPAENGEG